MSDKVTRPTAAAHWDGSPRLPFVRRLCYALNCSILEFIQKDGWPRDDFETQLMYWVRKNGWPTLRKFEEHLASMYSMRGQDILRRYIKFSKQKERVRQNEKERQHQFKYGEEL